MKTHPSLIIVNGSPRGAHSVSLRFARCLAALAQAESLEINVGTDGPGARAKARDALFAALQPGALVVWTYPVYTCGVPAQMLGFLDSLAADSRAAALAGVPFVQVLSSKHFFDTTAMAFLRAWSADQGMADCGAFSADPDDLLRPVGRERLAAFWRQAEAARREHRGLAAAVDGTGRKVLILGDVAAEDGLARGTAALAAALRETGAEVEIALLDQAGIRGGCLGCLRCTVAGDCAWQDGYGALMEKVVAADALVFAQRIVGRWFHPLWKRYDDRAFRFGHRLTLEGKPFLFLIGGDLAASPWLGELLEAKASIGGNPLAGVLVDPGNQAGFAPDAVSRAARTLLGLADGAGYAAQSFWRTGGLRIFRDLVWEMRGFMKLDHAFYQRHGLYDFPHKRRWSIFKGHVAGALLSIPAIRDKALPRMSASFGAPYDRVVADLERTRRP